MKKQPEADIQGQQSDTESPETSDFSRSQSRDPMEYTRPPRHLFPPDSNLTRPASSPSGSPLRPMLVSPRPSGATRTDVFGGSQYVQYGPENIPPSFVNGGAQFLPDIYVASNSLSFNPGNNTIAIMPTSPYESFGALLNSEIGPSVHQATTGQFRVSTGARLDNIAHTSRQDEEEQIEGASYYNPSERIERMFGISPPWRDR